MTRIRSNRFRSRRKRSHMNRLQAAALSRGFVLSLAVLVPVLTFAAWTVFGKDRRETKQPSASAAYAPDAPMESSSLPAAPAVTVQGVDLTGLNRSAAEKKLTEAFSWDVSVVWENDRLPFPNPLEPEIRRILDEIYAHVTDEMRKTAAAKIDRGIDSLHKSGEDKQRCQQKAAGIYPDELYNMFFLSLQTLS